MSIYSGKCDLCDHIGGMGGWYDRDGNPVKFGDENVHVYYSDEMQDFIEFKRRTGGVMYQHMRIEVTEFNQNFVAKKCDAFKVIEHIEKVKDKRLKSGEREKKTYTYEYFGKEYKTLKELNKKHVYITKEIHFDTLLDVIPYYPYIVSTCYSDKDKMVVYLSKHSYVDEQEESAYKWGREGNFAAHYSRKELQDHYREVVLRYYNPAGREQIELVSFNEEGVGYVSNPIDTNFYVKWKFDKPTSFWTSPEVIDADKGIIKMSKNDLLELGNKVNVYYVKQTDKKIYLG
ncbi:MAG: hypothetical protein J6V44_16740 [Methanobrevibacter sp.]|nr:hypothetical protein [Methanobrevibacter sp.]MBO7691948.1 hypothetical protein [Methanobrevibacter sp.]